MLRACLTWVTAGAAALGLAACGSSLNLSGFGEGGPADGGGSDSQGAEDSGVDASSAAADGGGDATPPTTALLVHASPDLPDQRFCWEVGGAGPSNTLAPFPSGAPAPASNYPAVPVGGAVPIADASSLVGATITLVGIDANYLAMIEQGQTTIPSCYARLTPGGAAASAAAVHELGTLPAGKVLTGAANVLAVVGCPPNDLAGSVARCGAGWSLGAGNLHVDVIPLVSQSAQLDAGQLAVQAAHVSPALDQLQGQSPAIVTFGAQGQADAGVVASLAHESTSGPGAPALLTLGTTPQAFGELGFGVDVSGADGGAAHLWMSLEQSLELFAPMQDPSTFYAQPTSYVAAVVGDPAHPYGAPDAAYDGTGLHVLVLPLP